MSVPIKRKRGRPRLCDSEDFDALLIKTIQAHSVLYDRLHPNFRSREEKEANWLQVAQTLSCRVITAKNRYLVLRGRYHNERRRIEKLRESGHIDINPEWRLYPLLTFLDDFRAPRVVNYSAKEGDDEDEDIDIDSTGQSRQSDLNQDPTAVYSSNSVQKYKAFGRFVSAALIDLPETVALELVQKFTTQLTRTMSA